VVTRYRNARRASVSARACHTALEQFLAPRSGDIVMRDTPRGPRPDSYAVGATLFRAAVELAGELVDHSALAAELARISGELQALPRP
jgi:hypothetical protein